MSVPPASRPRIGILGAGTVGSALFDRLANRDDCEVSGVLVRDPSAPRAVRIGSGLLTRDPQRVLSGADILVELMGGTGQAADLMLQALADGKPVVTANKAALAERWDEFLPYMRKGLVHFEAAVMAGTPAISPLTNVLRGSRPLELHAVLNGTCSYIISRLEHGESFAAALAEAQRLGYAEADPSLDIGGVDAAHKLAILARLAFDSGMTWTQVREATTGIEHLTPTIVQEAMEDGGTVMLLCSVIPEAGRWQASVRPTYLPAAHGLRAVDESRNGFLFRGRDSGEILVAGPGAGGSQTASAVLADILQVLAGRPGPQPLSAPAPVPLDYRPEELGELLLA